jgi:hypothetical protein
LVIAVSAILSALVWSSGRHVLREFVFGSDSGPAFLLGLNVGVLVCAAAAILARVLRGR